MRRSITIEVISALLMLLFIYAAMSKLLSYSAFVGQLHTQPLLKPFAGLLAWAVPAAELAIAALLVIPRTRLTGFTGALALMTIFTIYIAGMLLLDSHLTCSCSGVLENLTWKQHLVFNIFFTLLAFLGLQLGKRADLIQWNTRHRSPP